MNKPFIHDPAIYRDQASGRYYIYATHGIGFVSDDLIHWDNLGQVARVLPKAQAWALTAKSSRMSRAT